MILADYHMHSEFSSDSESPMEDMIESSIKKGLQTICFTDHMDYNYPKPDPTEDNRDRNFLFHPEEYFKKLNYLKEKYQKEIDIRIGIELGLQPTVVSQVENLLKNYTFDFIIGSSHLLYGEDPYYPSFWNQLSRKIHDSEDAVVDAAVVQTGIRRYFESILENIDLFPWFQVYGHLDYIVRYAPMSDTFYHVEDYMNVIDELLRKLIAQGRGIEINTSVLKKGSLMANPHTAILKRYHELGGEIITVGADAHCPEHIAYGFDKAKQFLQEAGFRYYTTFKGQKPEFHTL